MDQFEKHIRSNKEYFDEPFERKSALWDELEKQIPIEPTKPKKKWGKRMLGLLILFSLAFLGWKNYSQKRNIESLEYALEHNSELADINSYYGSLVSMNISKLESNTDLSLKEKQEFMHFIDDLAQEQELLRKELKVNIDNDKVLDAIIENFNQQIVLINQFLKRLEHENNTNEQGISM